MDIPLLRLFSARVEEQHGTDYYWDNRHRFAPKNVVVQQVLVGECFLRAEGKEYRIKPGQAFLFQNPEESQYGYPKDAKGVCRLRYVSFGGEDGHIFWDAFYKRFGRVITINPQSEASLRFQQLASHEGGVKFRDRYDESEQLYQFVMSLFRDQDAQRESADPVAYCYNYILNHHRSAFNIKSLLAGSGQSREHISRAFTERYGIAPGALLRKMRLQAACELLAVSHRSMDEVASSAGLSNYRTLARSFKATYGVTPDEWRKRRSMGFAPDGK